MSYVFFRETTVNVFYAFSRNKSSLKIVQFGHFCTFDASCIYLWKMSRRPLYEVGNYIQQEQLKPHNAVSVSWNWMHQNVVQTADTLWKNEEFTLKQF